MVDRASNTAYLTVVEPAPLENVGWTLRALSPRDYSTVVAVVDRFEGFGFNVDANDVGGGQVTLTADDPVLTRPLGGVEAGRLVDVEALWQVLEDGAVRFEWLGEDVDEDQVTRDGSRVTVFAGRGTGTVLDWAVVLPDGATLSRTVTGHPVAVWRTLFLEAQAAGFLPMVSLGFTDTVDSAGVPWGPDQELTVNAGDKLGDLLRRWSESNDLVWFMLPGFRLQVFQAYGSHLEGSVVFPVWRSQASHRRRINRRDLANVVYASSGDAVTVAEDSTSVGLFGKRAGWVTAGDAADASARTAVANTNLALLKEPRVGRTVQIIPGERRRPFEDFGLHDWVRVEVLDDDTASGVVRVVGLAVKVDGAGVVTHEATFQTRFEARAVRLQRLLDRLGAGTASGVGGAGSSDVSTAVTVSKALAAVKLADLLDVDLAGAAAGSVLRLEGSSWVDVLPGLSLLSDVDVSEVPATGDVVLGYDRDTGTWVPVLDQVGESGGSTPAASVPILSDWSYRDANRSTSAFAWKGNAFTPDLPVTLHAIAFYGTVVAGATYQAAVVTASGATVETVVKSAAVTMPGSLASMDGGHVWLWFAEPVALTVGTEYGLLAGRTDGAGTYPLPLPYTGTAGAQQAVPMPGRSHGRSWRAAVADLQVGSTLNQITTNSVGAGYAFSLGGS